MVHRSFSWCGVVDSSDTSAGEDGPACVSVIIVSSLFPGVEKPVYNICTSPGLLRLTIVFFCCVFSSVFSTNVMFQGIRNVHTAGTSYVDIAIGIWIVGYYVGWCAEI